jgi:hypothetical protein
MHALETQVRDQKQKWGLTPSFSWLGRLASGSGSVQPPGYQQVMEMPFLLANYRDI